MARYKVVTGYSAVIDRPNGRDHIALDEGSTVELDDDVAEFVSRDAPGVLEPEAAKPKTSRRKAGK